MASRLSRRALRQAPCIAQVERHARKRLRQWLCAKHKVSWPATKQFPEAALHDVLALVRLTTRTRSFPWATS